MHNPETIDFKITIGGDDVTDYCPRSGDPKRGLPGLDVTGEMGKVIDTARFALSEVSGLTIQEWDEVVITSSDESEKYFGGYLTSMREKLYGIELDMICDCQDYTAILEKSIVNAEWENDVDSDILADIRTDAEPDLSAFDFTTHVTSLGTVPRLRVPRRTVREALDELANRVGADWYIDYDKKLHWFSNEEVSASFNISDAPDYSSTFPCADLTRRVDGIEVINRVTVVGGAYISDEVDHEYWGDGQQLRFTVPHFYHAADSGSVEVYKNTGSDVSPVWTSQTLGIKYIDDDASPAKDVLFSFKELFFQFNSAPSNLKRGWKITAKFEVPLRTRVRSQASYDRYGRWFDGVINDPDIRDKTEAQKRARYYLAAQALAKTVYECKVYEPGLRSGQIIKITNAKMSVDEFYLIRTKKRRILGGGHVEDTLILGDYIADLYTLMAELARKAAGRVEWRDDEVLDELLEIAESLALSEAPTVSATSGPYSWGVGANDTAWGFGTWG